MILMPIIPINIWNMKTFKNENGIYIRIAICCIKEYNKKIYYKF